MSSISPDLPDSIYRPHMNSVTVRQWYIRLTRIIINLLPILATFMMKLHYDRAGIHIFFRPDQE